ncbi:MAG: hypothetical protein ACPGRZ_13840 [Alphaproteobacteria bacterium]
MSVAAQKPAQFRPVDRCWAVVAGTACQDRRLPPTPAGFGQPPLVSWRVWIIGSFQMEYGDGTEFLQIPLGPISFFISIMSGIASIAFLVRGVRYITGQAVLQSQDPRLNR